MDVKYPEARCEHEHAFGHKQLLIPSDLATPVTDAGEQTGDRSTIAKQTHNDGRGAETLSLNSKREETYRLARELAHFTGESVTEAVTQTDQSGTGVPAGGFTSASSARATSWRAPKLSQSLRA
jgi:Rv0623-like transcription factor